MLRLLTVAGIIFRAELVLLLAPLTLLFLAQRKIGLVPCVTLGVTAAFASLLATVAVDSFFWRRWLWPEAEVLYFNTVLNKSHEYGTSPLHWYFTSALPRALLPAYPLALASCYFVPRARQLVAVPALFVAVYSLLPHKELRFVLYVVPPLNVAAAAALAKLYTVGTSTRASSPAASSSAAAPSTASSGAVGILTRLLALGALASSAILAAAFLAAATLNYPGAAALNALHRIGGQAASGRGARSVQVHIGVDAAISGVSRYLELPPPWRYSKKEGMNPSEYRAFSYALVAADEEVRAFTAVRPHASRAVLHLRSPPGGALRPLGTRLCYRPRAAWVRGAAALAAFLPHRAQGQSCASRGRASRRCRDRNG